MKNLWNSVRRNIVEALFAKELDEDYGLGIDEARRATLVRLMFLRQNALKKDQPGLDLAIDFLESLQKAQKGAN